MGYASDITDEEWGILEPFLKPKQKGRPRQHRLRRMTKDDGRDPVGAENGLPVTSVVGGFSAVACGVHAVLALAEQRPVGTDQASTAPPRARERRKKSRSVVGDYRSSVGEDGAKRGNAATTAARTQTAASAISPSMRWETFWRSPFTRRAFRSHAAPISC